MRRADQITGLILLIFSIVLMEQSWRMPQSAMFGPGVGFFPFWLGALMAVLSVLLIVKASRQPAAPAEKPLFPSPKVLIPVGATIAGLAVYILLLEVLGFLVGTGLLTVFLLGAVERERWRTTLIVSVLNSVALYVIFQRLLGVSLHKNMFGF